MKMFFLTILSVNLFYLTVSAQTAKLVPSISVDDWVKKADQIRNPSQSFEMNVKVDDDSHTTEFIVFLKGQDKTLIVTKSPARDKGRNMLMLDRDFNAYVPNLKRSMRLSLAQKLSGQVSNGDISRTRWFGDYSVQLEKETNDQVQLLLKANKDNLTYAAIRLWIDKKNNHPLKAEYLGLNAQTILKRAYFEDYKTMAGALRPTTLRIEDVNKKTSFVRISDMKNKTFDDSFFTVRNMESMK